MTDKIDEAAVACLMAAWRQRTSFADDVAQALIVALCAGPLPRAVLLRVLDNLIRQADDDDEYCAMGAALWLRRRRDALMQEEEKIDGNKE